MQLRTNRSDLRVVGRCFGGLVDGFDSMFHILPLARCDRCAEQRCGIHRSATCFAMLVDKLLVRRLARCF